MLQPCENKLHQNLNIGEKPKMRVRFWLFGFIKHPADEESQQIRHRQGKRNTLTSSVCVYCTCEKAGAAVTQRV